MDARNDGSSLYDIISIYDEQGRRIEAQIDLGRDGYGVGDDKEIFTYNHLGLVSSVQRFTYEGSLKSSHSYEYNNDGQRLLQLSDMNVDGKIDRILFSPNVSHTEDMTAWTDEKLALFRPNSTNFNILLSDATASSKVILDKATIAKIIDGGQNIRITGESKDIVHLKDFTSSDKSGSTTVNDIYTVDIGGQKYNVIVENDVQLILG